MGGDLGHELLEGLEYGVGRAQVNCIFMEFEGHLGPRRTSSDRTGATVNWALWGTVEERAAAAISKGLHVIGRGLDRDPGDRGGIRHQVRRLRGDPDPDRCDEVGAIVETGGEAAGLPGPGATDNGDALTPPGRLAQPIVDGRRHVVGIELPPGRRRVEPTSLLEGAELFEDHTWFLGNCAASW